MQVSNKSGTTSIVQPGTTPLSPAAKKAWTLNFVVTPPKAMPADRLKARAELVRNATNSSTY